MIRALHKLLLFTVTTISLPLIRPQQSKEITIVEPRVIKLTNLFEMADKVALVKVVSGDTENYSTSVYKAELLKSYKGALVGKTVYFGPYSGVRLGWEYILFLRSVAAPLAPKATSNVNYATVQYFEVFNEGYSAMETSYECVFGGKQIADQCDYGVRVCTDYIVLPKTVRTFPPPREETPFGCRWIRKNAFISILETINESKK